MAFPFASHGGLHARIHQEFARHVNSRTTKALPVTYLPACCCVARSDPWPISVNYHLVDPHKDQLQPSTSKMASASSTSVTGKSGLMLDDVQERADYWKKLLWEATLSTDAELVEDRHEVVAFRNMLNALYDGVPPQTAASSALASTSYRHLQRLAEVSDEGLRRLQPELRRGQQRVLLIVSDSTIVFCKGSKKKRNFMKVMPTESLQKECKKDGGFSSYREIVCSPLWGKTLSHITDEVETQLEALRLKYPQYAGDTLLVDVLIFWSGNELTGHYGVFLDPGFNEDGYIWQGQPQYWADGTPKTLHVAQGDFADISRRVCRCVDRLSSLKAKQHTGFIALNGNVRHDLI